VSVGVLSRPTAGPSDAPRPASRLIGVVSRTLDSLSDVTVLAFASWTVLYHIGLIFHVPTNPLLIVWMLSIPGLALWLTRLTGRRAVPAAGEEATSGPSWGFGLPAIFCAAVSAGCVAFGGRSAVWWLGWVLAAVAAILGMLATADHRLMSAAAPRDAPSAVGTLVAGGTAVGLGVFSMFTPRGSADDAFYVNRAAWVADHGTLATRDTMFTNQSLPAIRGAGVPVASIESLQGAVAHVLHIAGGSVAYLATPEIATFLAVWAVWRLVRSWAPRRATLCFLVAVIYLVWACAGRATLGRFFITESNEGKVIFLSMLAPLIYLYLTSWMKSRDRRTAVLMAAAGVAAVGFTSSATFLVPLVCATAVFSLVVTRHFRVAAGAVLPAVYPIAVGIVVHFIYAEVAPNSHAPSPPFAMHYVFGHSWFAAIGWFAVLCGVWTVRTGAPKLATAAIPVMLLIVLAPGVLAVMNAATGAGAVLWRTMWVAPTAVLVGLLAAVPVPHRVRWAAPLPAAGLVGALILVGMPLWAPRNGLHITSRPSWHFATDELDRARELLQRRPQGPVLAPPATMRAVALLTTSIHAVSPRLSYDVALDEPAVKAQARALLVTLITGGAIRTPATTIRFALDVLDVSLVCGLPDQTHRQTLFRSAGYLPTRGISGEWCLRRPGP
jgi:Family of unknown function (DUF6077)